MHKLKNKGCVLSLFASPFIAENLLNFPINCLLNALKFLLWSIKNDNRVSADKSSEPLGILFFGIANKRQEKNFLLTRCQTKSKRFDQQNFSNKMRTNAFALNNLTLIIQLGVGLRLWLFVIRNYILCYKNLLCILQVMCFDISYVI